MGSEPSRRQLRKLSGDDYGSASVESLLVMVLLTFLTLGLLQLALIQHVRTTALDAASEGARFAALADTALGDGVERTRELITAAIGSQYAADISVSLRDYRGHPAVAITVRTPLPVIGIWGPDGGIEVTGHAAAEVLDAN